MRLRAAFIAVLAALALAAPAQADTFTVTNGSSDSTAACTGTSCPSLRAAIAASEATKGVPDVINVPAGTININNDLVIQSDITVNGSSARTNIIDGGFKYRGFRVSSTGSAKINHFTIRNGAGSQGGTPDGGGILNASGVVQLTYVRVTTSQAGSGGSGGGIANVEGTMTMSHTLVDNNTAFNGAGIANIGGPETPDRGLLGLVDSTVFKNTASTGGTGGIDSRGGTANAVILNRVTVADNVGGVRGLGGLQLLSGTGQVLTSIIARNLVGTASANCGDVKPSNSTNNVENDKECSFDLGAVNPGLATSLSSAGGELDVLALTAASPAVDHAPLSACSASATSDQRDLARPQGLGCDSGAYELDQAPTVTINSGPTGTINVRNATFTYSTTEPNVTLQCRLTGPGQSGTFATCSSATSQAYSSLADGSYTFSVRALDGVFATPPVASQSFVVDATLDTAITNGPTGPTNDTTPTFTFTGSGGAVSFQCRFDTTAFAACASPFTPTAGLGQGAHTFEVRAMTAAGGADTTPASRSFTVDTTPPDTTITGGPSNSVASTTATFTFTSTEAGSTFQCSLDGAALGACPLSYAGLGQGAHTLQVRAIDVAGNPDASTASRTWTVDTVAPNTTLTPIASPTNDATPSFTFGSSETGSTFECRVDSAAYASCTSPFTTAALTDGPHTIDVRAVDAAGNADPTPGTQAFVVDAAAPNTTIATGPSGATNDATPTFTFTSDEAGSTFACSVDGAAFAACTSPFTALALADGAHTFEVRAIDNHGITDGTPASHTFTVDTTPPAAPDVVSGPDGPTTNSSPAFAFAAADAASTACRLDGPGGAQGEFGTCASPKAFNALAPGDYVFFVRSIDAAGNEQTTQRAFTVTVLQQATPTPSATPTPTPTPVPTPVANQSVDITPVSGTVLIKLPGSKVFVKLSHSLIKNGAEVDARQGVVEITRSDGGKAKFFDGIFKLSHAGGYTVVTLAEKLTGCPKAKKSSASAAAKKPKSRKLWGDGKGKFRTKGSYSAATVRGTKWLVTDTCTTTVTRVATGVVEVQDFTTKKKILVKKGRTYTARAKRR